MLVLPSQTRISQPRSTPVFNPKLIPNALWLGSQSNRDLISGLYPTVVQDVTLNQPSYNGAGVYLNSATQSTTRRLTLNSNASAVSIGSDDFTVFVLFQSLGNAASITYRLPGIMRWNTASQANTNEWFLAIDSTTPRPTFQVEVGAVYYSAIATTPSLVNGEWYTLVGIRKGTTISVYCKRQSTGQIGFNSTTNAGITTVNTGKAVGTYLGEVKGANLYDNMRVPIAGTFKRALVESEVKLLLDNPWQIFQPDRRSIYFNFAAAGIDLASNAQSSSTATGDLAQSTALSASAISEATATGQITQSTSLSASASGVATATGDVSTSVPGTALAGSATASATATGALSQATALTGSASTIVTASGTVNDLTPKLAGNAVSTATASATFFSELKRVTSYRYAPGVVPEDLPSLVRFLQLELYNIKSGLDSVADGHLDKSYTAPYKPSDGDIRYADGSYWNPGSGQGIYRYNGSAWVFLG